MAEYQGGLVVATMPRVLPVCERRLIDSRLTIRQQSADDIAGPLRFEGHAAVFGVQSEPLADAWGGTFREVIEQGAFRDVLDSDVRLLLNHDPNFVLARTTSGTLRLSEDEVGLFVEAELAPTSYARDLAVVLERGDISQMSFAFVVDSDGQTWEQAPDGTWLRRITRISQLYDVSIVTYPAYTSTDAALRQVRAAGYISPADLRKLADELEARRQAHPRDQVLRKAQQAARHKALAIRYSIERRED